MGEVIKECLLFQESLASEVQLACWCPFLCVYLCLWWKNIQNVQRATKHTLKLPTHVRTPLSMLSHTFSSHAYFIGIQRNCHKTSIFWSTPIYQKIKHSTQAPGTAATKPLTAPTTHFYKKTSCLGKAYLCSFLLYFHSYSRKKTVMCFITL